MTERTVYLLQRAPRAYLERGLEDAWEDFGQPQPVPDRLREVMPRLYPEGATWVYRLVKRIIRDEVVG